MAVFDNKEIDLTSFPELLRPESVACGIEYRCLRCAVSSEQNEHVLNG